MPSSGRARPRSRAVIEEDDLFRPGAQRGQDRLVGRRLGFDGAQMAAEEASGERGEPRCRIDRLRHLDRRVGQDGQLQPPLGSPLGGRDGQIGFGCTQPAASSR